MIFRIALRWAALTAAIASAGCAVKDAPKRNPHDVAAESEPPRPSRASRSAVESDRALAKVPERPGSRSEDDLGKQLRDNAAAVNPATMDDPDSSRSNRQQERLRLFDEALIELARRGSQAVTEPDRAFSNDGTPISALDAYARALFAGCEADGTQCRHVSYLRQDAGQSGRAAALLLPNAKTARDRYRILNLAFAVKNGIPDPQLEVVFFSGFQALREEMERDPRPQDRRLFGSTSAVVGILFQTRGNALPYGDWLDALDGWSYRRFDPSALGATAADVFRFAAQKGMYAPDGSLRAPVARAVSQTKSDELGYYGRRKLLRERTRVALGVAEIGEADEYALIADRVYRGVWTPADAFAAWSGSHRDAARMSAVLRAYVQLEFALAVQETHSGFARFFKDRMNLILNESALIQAIEKGRDLAPIWKDRFLNQAENVKAFAALAFGAKFGGPSEPRPELRALSSLLNNLRWNIKTTIVYPAMLAISYQMARYDMNFVLKFAWLKFEIRPELILGQMFNAAADPWFDFGGDMQPATRPEMLQSYYWFLAAGGADEWGIDPADLFEVTSRKLVGPDATAIRNRTFAFADAYAHADWANLRAICDGLRDGKPYVFSRSLDDLRIGGFLGAGFSAFQDRVGTLGGTYGQVGSMSVETRNRGFNPHSDASVLNGEAIRLVIDPQLGTLRALGLIHRSALERAGEDGAQAQKIMAAIQARIDEYQNIRDRWLVVYHSARKPWEECYLRMVKHETDVDVALLRLESQFLRDLHRDLARLRAAPAGEREAIAREITEARAFRLPDGYDGESVASADGYFARPVDFRIRVARYLERGYGGEPPVDANVRVRIPGNVRESAAYGVNNEGSFVPFIENEDAFVNAALRTYADQRSQFLVWFQTWRMNASAWSTWQGDMAMYYRIGPAPGDVARTSIEPNEIIERTLDMVRAASVTDGEASLMKTIGRDARLDRLSLSTSLLDYATHEPLPYFENVFDWMMRDYLGYVGYVQKFPTEDARAEAKAEWQPPLATAKNYAFARALQGANAFEFPAAIDAAQADFQRNRVRTELERRAAFEARLAERERVDLTTGAAPTLRFEVDDPVRMPYVTGALRGVSRAQISAFHRDTGGCFRATAEARGACPW